MPTEELTRHLQQLVDALRPLAQKRPGEVIEADDWNAVVGAVVDLAGEIAALPDEAPGAHVHLDAVSADWLVPALRALVTGGGGSDPATSLRISALEVDLGRLRQEATGVRAGVDDVRDRLSGVLLRDTERQDATTRIARRLDAAGDARADIEALRASVGRVEEGVAATADLAARLTVGGRPVDVGALVGEVGELRQRLTKPDGTAFTARDLDQRLADLRTGLVTDDELDDALKSRVGGLSAADRGRLLEAARDAARTEATGRVDERVGALEAGLDARVAAATAPLADQVAGQVADRLTGSITSSVRDQVSQDLAGRLDAQVADAVGSATGDLRAQLGALAARDEAITTDLAAVQARAGAADERSAAIQAALDGLDARIDERAKAAAVDAAGAMVRDQVELSVRQQLDVLLGGRLDAVVRDQLTSALGPAVEQAVGVAVGQAVDQAVGPAVDRAVAGRTDALRSELADQLRSQIGDQLRSELGDQLRTQLTTDLSTSLTGVVNDRLKTGFDQLEVRLRPR